MSCNRLKTWAVDYSIRFTDGKEKESGFGLWPVINDKYGALPSVRIRAKTISQAVRIAEVCICGALRMEPDITAVKITFVGIVDDDVF